MGVLLRTEHVWLTLFAFQLKDTQKEKELDEGDPSALTANWYPTLVRTLSSLAKLYLSVDSSVFEDLAHEVPLLCISQWERIVSPTKTLCVKAVSVCIASLSSASRLISRSKGSDHGQLFLLRHLLILREQIQPFDANFTITENTLDFSRLSEAVSRVLSGQFAIGKYEHWCTGTKKSPLSCVGHTGTRGSRLCNKLLPRCSIASLTRKR